MLYDSLRKKMDYYDSVVADIKKRLPEFPNGYLKVSPAKNKCGKNYQYYVRDNKSDPSGRYLPKGERAFAKQLAQKEYCGQILKTAEKEKKRIVRFLKDSDENALLNAYLKMNPGKRILVEPYVIPDDEYAEKWQELKYTGGLFDEDDSVYYTKRGDRVRSKSEQMIADRLFDAHIPYRYEFPLVYDGTKHIFTDFTVLNKRTRVTYRWEHFGKMDDPKYRKTFFWKQSVYSQLGYTQGLNLVFTFEDNDNPLDMRVVDRLIKRLFL